MRKQPIFKSGNSVIWLILAVVVVLVVIGSFYWLMDNKFVNKSITTNTTYTKPVTGGNVTFDDLQKEVEVEDVSKDPSGVQEDFTALDKDLQDL